MSKNPNHACKSDYQAMQTGMYIVAGSPSSTNDKPVTKKPDEKFILPKGHVYDPNRPYPLEMYGAKTTIDDTVIRRTRSLIPHSVKCQIIQLAQDNPRITQGEIAQMYGIDRTTVSKILKRRHKFLEEAGLDSSTSPPKMMKTDDVVNEALYNYINLWYLDAVKRGEEVTQSKIIEVAHVMAKSYGATDLSVDNDWLCKFFIKHNVKDLDIEDLVKTEYASSSDEVPSMFELYENESRNSPPKEANFNKTKPGNRHHHPSLQQHHVTSPRQATPSSTVTSSQQGTVSSTRPGTGNKIPKVQTETADTTREDLLDIKKEMDEIDTKEALRREMGNLEKFREQQKMIEEANKQRKALLSKTLSERQKAAQQEARKLAHIQREVMILDNLLTADVNVIRSRIEVASREFLDAQKRYERAEKEFIDAKMDLQKKSEHKEQLTEHLYTIIHQNELRKANKLSELMKELEMEQNAESQILPTLPPLSAFNSVSTLHSPKSPPHTTETMQSNPETLNQASPTKSSSDQDKNVKHNENTKSVICLGSDDSVDNSGDYGNSKQSNSNVQDSISDSSRNVKNVNLKDGTAKDQSLKTDEIVIEGLSTNSNPSVNNESRTENIEGGGVVDLTSDSGSGTCETEPKSVTSEKGDNHGKHKPEVALPSAWTLDVVKNEHIS